MYLVKMPRLGITMTSGKVARWLVEEGASVKAGENLFEMESDKSTVEIETQADGVLRKILVAEGTEVDVNTVIAVIADRDEDIDLASLSLNSGAPAENVAAPQAGEPAANSIASPPVSPRLRKIAHDLGVNLADVAFPGAMLTEADVRRHAEHPTDDTVVELSATQKAMADHLTHSWATIPHFTQIVSVDMTQILAAKAGGMVGLNAILIKLIGDAAVNHRFINGRFENGRLVVAHSASVGIAVTTDAGLMVPVIEAVETMSLQQVEAALQDIAARAKSGDRSGLTTKGGTITFSNLGAYGIETGTPVINAPQSTLVFAGAIIRKPVVRGDEIIIAPVMKLSVCFDHRLIEGAVAAAFTGDLKARIESYCSC